MEGRAFVVQVPASMITLAIFSRAQLCEIPHSHRHLSAKKADDYPPFGPPVDLNVEVAFPCHIGQCIIVARVVVSAREDLSTAIIRYRERDDEQNCDDDGQEEDGRGVLYETFRFVFFALPLPLNLLLNRSLRPLSFQLLLPVNATLLVGSVGIATTLTLNVGGDVRRRFFRSLLLLAVLSGLWVVLFQLAGLFILVTPILALTSHLFNRLFCFQVPASFVHLLKLNTFLNLPFLKIVK